ncbi:MAG: GHKL domain-containing protein [Mycobacteriaceae bacterium]|nr:GHKL domain-containing protein [Mycobacteriaceae bacterium]
MRLATQILLFQLAVIALTLGIAYGLLAVLYHSRLINEYGNRCLAIAQVVAAAPAVRSDVASYRDATPAAGDLAGGPLQRLATQVRQGTGVLFVVITNNRGIRLSHPNTAELGKPVSTDPSVALSGKEEVVEQTGTLGPSIRAKVPILAPDSTQVAGTVSVGMSTSSVYGLLRSEQRLAALTGGPALLTGVALSVLLARRWRKQTLDLQPPEMTELVRTQEAVLHGIGEGVLATDTDGRTTFVNDEACRLLEIGSATGAPADQIGLTPRVLEVLRSCDPTPTLATVGERVLVVSARPVSREGRELGTVLVVRDRTDVELLTRQLDAVKLMSTVLRAQRHEFANRLHLLNGLLHNGNTAEAARYLEELLGSGPLSSALPHIQTIRDPFLQAFLAAKAAAAREAGATLRVGENSWAPGWLTLPVDVTTVMGNLLDNAIDAVRTSDNDSKIVDIELLQDDATLHITVGDSGDGVPSDFVDQVFVEGTSTKPQSDLPGGRGIGLALSRQIARGLGGDIRLSSSGNPGDELCGAEFIARLPGVMAKAEL